MRRRHFEVAALLSQLVLSAYMLWRAAQSDVNLSAWGVVWVLFAAYVCADLVSGMVHWLADNYGSGTMPVWGQFVRTFREHHQIPTAITHHDFVEANGDSAIVCVPTLSLALLLPGVHPQLYLFTVVFTASIILTTQAHKWSHMAVRPLWVRVLQRSRIILSVEHHALHHRGAHDTHYCITTGWLNGILPRLRYWQMMHWMLDTLGMPRRDENADILTPHTPPPPA